jgi:hypothetical protein
MGMVKVDNFEFVELVKHRDKLLADWEIHMQQIRDLEAKLASADERAQVRVDVQAKRYAELEKYSRNLLSS